MIPVQAIPAKPADEITGPETPKWKQELADSITTPVELLDFVGLGDEADLLLQANSAQQLFKLRVTKSFAKRIQPGNPQDPLLLQVLPLGLEHIETQGYSSDPVGDLHAQQQPGLLHKYHGRVLLVTTGSCAINCRYCFRREYPYEDASAPQNTWQQSLDYIKRNNSITEVILSGGDPLTLSDKRLNKLITQLESITHLKRLRIHSRLPIVLPSRITDFLVERLQQSRLKSVFVVHSNHAQELNSEVAEAMEKLQRALIPCFNQAVLLKGVNDSLSALIELSERLFDLGITPYYLHLLDKATGTAHFNVSETNCAAITFEITGHFTGLFGPQLVQEIAGEPNKSPIWAK